MGREGLRAWEGGQSRFPLFLCHGLGGLGFGVLGGGYTHESLKRMRLARRWLVMRACVHVRSYTPFQRASSRAFPSWSGLSHAGVPP